MNKNKMEKFAEDLQILAHHNRGKILFFKGEGGNMISPMIYGP
jgi:hypothetical protein